MCECVCPCAFFHCFSLPFHQILIYVVCVTVCLFVGVEQNGGGMVWACMDKAIVVERKNTISVRQLVAVCV